MKNLKTLSAAVLLIILATTLLISCEASEDPSPFMDKIQKIWEYPVTKLQAGELYVLMFLAASGAVPLMSSKNKCNCKCNKDSKSV